MSDAEMIVEPFKNVLVIWTIYENPSDFPGEFVARPHVVGKGGKMAVGLKVKRSRTLDGVRDQLPRGLIRFPRTDGDPEQIVESWM